VKKYLIEGRPGVGKTTLLCCIAERLPLLRIGGFYTAEIREGENRVGFRIHAFTGRSGVMAHVTHETGPRVGKYRVDIPTFEQVGIRELERALRESDIIFIDEIGKMELFSERFREMLRLCLNSDKPVIATIMSGPNPFADQIKNRQDVQRVHITLENRDRIVTELIKQIVLSNGGLNA
jgi:nucleoside-triphosphatase